MIPKKVFITGASGLIGREMIRHYSKSSIVYTYSSYDWNRYGDIYSRMRWFEPDLIINCGAEIYDETKMICSNVVMVEMILDYVQNFPTRFIQFGSSSEYGIYDRPTKEDDELLATDVYGKSKIKATELCMEYVKNFNSPITVIRPYSVFGKNEKERKFFPKLYKALKTKAPFTLTNGYHDWVHIYDFMEVFISIVDRQSNLCKGDIINIGSGVQYSNFEVLDMFLDVMGIKECPEYIEKKDIYVGRDTKVWCADTTKLFTKYSITEHHFDSLGDWLNHLNGTWDYEWRRNNSSC